MLCGSIKVEDAPVSSMETAPNRTRQKECPVAKYVNEIEPVISIKPMHSQEWEGFGLVQSPAVSIYILRSKDEISSSKMTRANTFTASKYWLS